MTQTDDGGPQLPQTFFADDAPHVAQRLLGCMLVHKTSDGVRIGRIVETEAYDQDDPASHSCRGITPRTQVMFGPAGVAYVYRSYGLHWCLNIVTGPQGFGAAVLLRALAPVTGAKAMALARAQARINKAPIPQIQLCRGPGNLTQAMGINFGHNGADVTDGPLYLRHGLLGADEQVAAGPRIGISVAQQVPWRFYLVGHPAVSGRRGPPLIASRRA